MPEVLLEQKFSLVKEHFELELKEKGEYTGIREFRKHLAYYTKNLANSSSFRGKINTLETKEDVLNTLDEYYKYLNK